MKNAYNVALGDWFHPPVIQRLGRYGTAIRIWATDDVQVLDEAGKVRETGEAIRARGDWWEYVPSVTGTIVVEVRDLPGNVVKAEDAE